MARLIVDSLDDDKAADIVTIDLAKKTAFADYMVIATGQSGRQIQSMAAHLVDMLHAKGVRPTPIEGSEAGEWLLIDAGDVIVHLFKPETRARYNIEKMWRAEFAEPERAAMGG